MVIAGGIDLSFSSILACCAVLAAWLQPHSFWLAVIAPLVLGASLGEFNGLLVAKVGANPLITTLGTQWLFLAVLFILTGGGVVQGNTLGPFTLIAHATPCGVPLPIGILLVTALATWFLASHASLGKYIYAHGSNRHGLRFAGIGADNVYFWTFVLMGLFVGLGGVVLSSRLEGVRPTEGERYLLAVLTAVLLSGVSLSGGVGSIFHVLVATVVLGVIDNSMVLLAVRHAAPTDDHRLRVYPRRALQQLHGQKLAALRLAEEATEQLPMPSAALRTMLLRRRLSGIIAVLLLFMACYDRSFFTFENLLNILSYSSINGMLAAGMTLLMISREFDISVGSTLVLSGVIAVEAANRYGAAAGLALGIASGAALGLVNGLLVAKANVNSFIATLGTMVIYQGIAFALTDMKPVAVEAAPFQVLGIASCSGCPPQILYFALMALALWARAPVHADRQICLCHRRQSQRACRLLGINVDGYRIAYFVICGLCASFAGVVLASKLAAASATFGENIALVVIAAIVLGGVPLSGGAGDMPGVVAADPLAGTDRVHDHLPRRLRLLPKALFGRAADRAWWSGTSSTPAGKTGGWRWPSCCSSRASRTGRPRRRSHERQSKLFASHE